MSKKLYSRFLKPLFIILIFFPLLTIFVWSFIERWEWPSLVPTVFSNRAMNVIFRNKQDFFKLIGSGILISGMVALLSVITSTMAARAFVFYEVKYKNLINFLSLLPFMVPATVFGMGIQSIFIKWGLNNSILGVVIAHLIYSQPYAFQLMLAGTESIGRTYEELARSLGANAWQAFYKISLPMLMPVILASASMAFVVSFGQYFLTLIVGGGQVKTFAIVMVPYIQSGERNIAAIYSLFFLIILFIINHLLNYVGKKVEEKIYKG
ncbi:MAG: ABC transporter permease subunit [Tissierellia bacterium]|nr:ABC transporter permease subunit [Tissierellia bacterium]